MIALRNIFQLVYVYWVCWNANQFLGLLGSQITVATAV